jgi:hypothetical protein
MHHGHTGKNALTVEGSKMAYPLADKDVEGWYSEGDYLARGGSMRWMCPREYLARVRPLLIDETSRENMDDLKDHILSGGSLDPLLIRADGREDGRHRANACIELGIALVPVIVFEKG